MLLKDEPIQDNSFDFLETTITYKGHTDFDIKHKDKNIHSLLHHNKLKKVKNIHASSFAPQPQATNIVLNTLHRINNNCSSDSLKALASIEHFYVATHFGYTKKHFQKALKTMHLTTDNNLWDSLTAILRKPPTQNTLLSNKSIHTLKNHTCIQQSNITNSVNMTRKCMSIYGANDDY